MNPNSPHGNQPPPPPPFYLSPLPPTPPLPPIPVYHVPQSTSWWVWARLRIIGVIDGTDNFAYEMSNTEVVGHIRVIPNYPKEPIILISSTFARVSSGMEVTLYPAMHPPSGACNSTPNAGEVCFDNIKHVSIYCI